MNNLSKLNLTFEMSKNPLYNALIAILYIIVLVFGMNFFSKSTFDEDIASLIVPIIMISLFTLSAAVMGYLFCFQPIRLYLDGKKDEAVRLFVKTVLIFGALTLGLVLIYLILARII